MCWRGGGDNTFYYFVLQLFWFTIKTLPTYFSWRPVCAITCKPIVLVFFCMCMSSHFVLCYWFSLFPGRRRRRKWGKEEKEAGISELSPEQTGLKIMSVWLCLLLPTSCPHSNNSLSAHMSSGHWAPLTHFSKMYIKKKTTCIDLNLENRRFPHPARLLAQPARESVFKMLLLAVRWHHLSPGKAKRVCWQYFLK